MLAVNFYIGGKVKINLSKNFSVQEAQHSDYAEKRGLENTLPAKYYVNALKFADNILEPIRVQFGAFSPNSWYRCEEINKAVGGSPTSDHMLGCAADISIKGVDDIELARWIVNNLTFKQVILEESWVHVSYLEGDNRGQVLHKTKNGYGIGL